MMVTINVNYESVNMLMMKLGGCQLWKQLMMEVVGCDGSSLMLLLKGIKLFNRSINYQFKLNRVHFILIVDENSISVQLTQLQSVCVYNYVSDSMGIFLVAMSHESSRVSMMEVVKCM